MKNNGESGGGGDEIINSPMSEEEREELRGGRSGSLLVYHPGLHGVREGLPKVLVVDTEEGEDGEGNAENGRFEGKMEMTKTARPPVELM